MMQIIKKLTNACFEYDDEDGNLEIYNGSLNKREARALYKFLHKIFGEEKK